MYNSNGWVEHRIAGIPCVIEVTHLNYQAPSGRPALLCDSPSEFYGDFEAEFNILDRKGYSAAWLERKLDEKEIERVIDAIYIAFRKGEI